MGEPKVGAIRHGFDEHGWMAPERDGAWVTIGDYTALAERLADTQQRNGANITKLEQAEERLAGLENAFGHRHKNRQDGTDICAHCRLDLRDAIHFREGA